MIKVLFLASNPENTSSLKLDEEIRLITHHIRGSEHRDVLELESLLAVRPDDLLQALNEHKPDIVHFSGHGSSAGEIVLMDRNRQAKPVSTEALQMLFKTLKDNIRVVVLNACYSQTQATAIAEVIDCVVGMSKAVGDDAAITFAASFYRAIGFGRSIEEAFEQGRIAILLEGIDEADIPQLMSRPGVDPASIFLIGGASSPRYETIPELDIRRRGEVIDAFLACDSFRDREGRNTIVDNLPQQIRSTIKRHPADRVDTANIIDRCLAFSGGLAALINTLRLYEGDSKSMQQIDDLFDQLDFDPA